MIDRVLSAGSYLIAGTVIQAILAFAGNVIMLRALGPDEFGRFAVTLAGISLIAGLVSLRLGTVVIRTPDSALTIAFQKRYFTAMLAETGLVAALSTAWLIASGRTGWTDMLLLAAVAVQLFCSHARAFWERTMPFGMIAILETVVAALAQMAGVVIVLMTASEAAFYIREAVAAGAMLTGLWLVGGLTWRPLVWPRLNEWIQVFREARGAWLDAVLEGLFQRLTVLAAAMIGGHQGAGLFSMAQRLAILPHQLIQPLGRVAATWFSRAEESENRSKGRDRLILTVAGPLAVAGVLTIAAADPLVPWIFGEHWRDAVPILMAMSGAILFMSMFEITRSYALVIRRTQPLLAARAAQFAAFGIGLAAAWFASDARLIYLGGGFSAAFAMAFAAQFALLRRRESA